jgi:hypothetical protein
MQQNAKGKGDQGFNEKVSCWSVSFQEKECVRSIYILAIEVFSENSKSMNKKLTHYLFLNSVKYKILCMNMRFFKSVPNSVSGS